MSGSIGGSKPVNMSVHIAGERMSIIKVAAINGSCFLLPNKITMVCVIHNVA